MSQTVTHKDLARKLKVSETTIKSYRRKFADCIPVASDGKPIRFLPEAVAVCTRIRDLFDLGMSIEEVRARLAQEFPWVSLVAKEKDAQASGFPGLPQEFTIAISNLAKSMVTLTQQQNSIMERMDRLESVFANTMELAATPIEGAGVKAADFRVILEDLQGYIRNALLPLQQLQRLNEVQNLAEVLHQAAGNMVDTTQKLRSLTDKSKINEISGTEPSAKVVPFHGHSIAQNTSVQQAVPQDPPRQFLLKPMVVRTVEGVYIGAGGRSRGRFTLNDFKALLVYGRQPGEHFSLHWEQSGTEWIAILTQPQAENPGKWQLHLKEVMSQSGIGVVELVGFTANGQDTHPAEFCVFVAGLTEVQP